MTDFLNSQYTPQTTSTLSPGVQWAQTASPSLKKTRFGLSLVLWGYAIMIICMFGITFGIMISFGANGFKEKGLSDAISVLRILFAFFIDFVGPIYCLAVPTESGAKRFLMMSILFNLIGIINSIVHLLAPIIFSSIFIKPFGFLSFIGTFIFIIFLKKFAEYIGRDDLGSKGKKILIVYIIFFVMEICTFEISIFPKGLTALLFFLGAITGLIYFLLYITLINDLRKSMIKT
ncbi:MAG: hypothetical protein ABSG67_02505 [Thermoguttaceae bacterium]|jgi:hypothetical protein